MQARVCSGLHKHSLLILSLFLGNQGKRQVSGPTFWAQDSEALGPYMSPAGSRQSPQVLFLGVRTLLAGSQVLVAWVPG